MMSTRTDVLAKNELEKVCNYMEDEGWAVRSITVLDRIRPAIYGTADPSPDDYVVDVAVVFEREID